MDASKVLLLALSVVSSVAFADPKPEMSCTELEIFVQDQNGNGTFVRNDMQTQILSSNLGKYGLVASISSGGKTSEEKDVQLQIVQPTELNDVKEMASLLLPNLDWNTVQSIRVGNIGVEANRKDSAGIFIFELRGQDEAVVGKLAQIGWSVGRCGTKD
jgi:hypothetical protein